MKKVLKNVLIGIGWYSGMSASLMIVMTLSLDKLEKRIGRDLGVEEMETLVSEDPVVQWLNKTDNCILRTMTKILCMPFIYLSISNTAEKIKF